MDSKLLGSYLKDRRAKLNPADFGISPIRGGSPSAEVLNRIAEALGLTPVEREHLFFLAQQRAPQVHYQAWEPISTQLQRVLYWLEYSPAMVKTPTWDIIAWNEAACGAEGLQ